MLISQQTREWWVRMRMREFEMEWSICEYGVMQGRHTYMPIPAIRSEFQSTWPHSRLVVYRAGQVAFPEGWGDRSAGCDSNVEYDAIKPSKGRY